MRRILLTPFSLDRREPLLETIRQDGWMLHQPRLSGGSCLERTGAINEGIALFTERAVLAGDVPACVTGDCCAAIGMLTGLQRAGLTPQLLWLDAHGDFNTPETTPSGFIGGMPLAMLVGRGDQKILTHLGTRPLDEAAVLLCDARDLDRLERQALESSRVTHMPSVDGLATWDFGPGPVHVHLDPDIISPLDAPAMAYATPGGPRLGTLEALLKEVAARTHIVSVSLTTWAVGRDADGTTAAAVLRTLDAILGEAAQ
jgi:arginase